VDVDERQPARAQRLVVQRLGQRLARRDLLRIKTRSPGLTSVE